ncbi:hypothetical protein ACFSTJ_20205 [Ottowia pentelensis]|uniref:hypothetical protein n=1 Tax=Ottowia pentelensis TaxID=511108 RepID=UPI0036277F08
MFFGDARIAQGLQQAGLQLRIGLPALVFVFAALHLAAQGKPALGPGLQALGWGAVGVIAGVLGFFGVPGVEAGLDVALEDFGQVVVAEELVFVGDASEGLYGFEDGHGQAWVTLARWLQRWQRGGRRRRAPVSRAGVRW